MPPQNLWEHEKDTQHLTVMGHWERTEASCKSAREKSSGNWIFIVSGESKTDLQDEKYSFYMQQHKGEVCLSENLSPPPSNRYAAWKAVGTSYGARHSVSPSAFVIHCFCRASVFQGQSCIVQYTYISVLCISLCKGDEQHPSRKIF